MSFPGKDQVLGHEAWTLKEVVDVALIPAMAAEAEEADEIRRMVDEFAEQCFEVIDGCAREMPAMEVSTAWGTALEKAVEPRIRALMGEASLPESVEEKVLDEIVEKVFLYISKKVFNWYFACSMGIDPDAFWRVAQALKGRHPRVIASDRDRVEAIQDGTRRAQKGAGIRVALVHGEEVSSLELATALDQLLGGGLEIVGLDDKPDN